jgi:hypothetical protein
MGKQFSVRPSGLIIPGSSTAQRIKFGEWDIFGEHGQVCWLNRNNGQFIAHTPDIAVERATAMFESILGPNHNNSNIACDAQQYKQWKDVLQAIIEIAKDQRVVHERNLEKAKKIQVAT